MGNAKPESSAATDPAPGAEEEEVHETPHDEERDDEADDDAEDDDAEDDAESPASLAPPSSRSLGDPAELRPTSPFDRLDAQKIVLTAERLQERIHERFPQSGLSKLCGHLVVLAEDAHETAEWIARPHVPLRNATAVFSVLIVAGVVASVAAVPFGGNLKLVEMVSGVEAAINDLVLIGAALFFLVSLETRIKRHRALQALHRLRSLAHITDMHQLTKSPDRLEAGYQALENSPTHRLPAFELGRYLDYCSEMLSLTGKIAALYIQDFDDSVALQAVNEIEALTTGLSRKIWQKRTASLS
mgnify:CR=1 FL=1